jgi:hypothetical protein
VETTLSGRMAARGGGGRALALSGRTAARVRADQARVAAEEGGRRRGVGCVEVGRARRAAGAGQARAGGGRAGMGGGRQRWGQPGTSDGGWWASREAAACQSAAVEAVAGERGGG